MAGLAAWHALVADHAGEPGEVIVGIEIDRGLLVDALVGAGDLVGAINPLAAGRYRARHSASGARSDAGDATVLADLVRTAADDHRPVAADSDQASAIRVLARGHHGPVWMRQRQLGAPRSGPRDHVAAAPSAVGTDLASAEALALLAIARAPGRVGTCRGRGSPRPWAALAARNLDRRAAAIQSAARADHPQASAAVADAVAAAARARVAVPVSLNAPIAELERRLAEHLIDARAPRSGAVVPGSAWSAAPGCSAARG